MNLLKTHWNLSEKKLIVRRQNDSCELLLLCGEEAESNQLYELLLENVFELALQLSASSRRYIFYIRFPDIPAELNIEGDITGENHMGIKYIAEGKIESLNTGFLKSPGVLVAQLYAIKTDILPDVKEQS